MVPSGFHEKMEKLGDEVEGGDKARMCMCDSVWVNAQLLLFFACRGYI